MYVSREILHYFVYAFCCATLKIYSLYNASCFYIILLSSSFINKTGTYKKKRVAGHKNDIKYHNPGSDGHKAGTRLSRHCGGMKLKGIPYTIEWSILKRTNGAFNPKRNFCQLCCMEKYLIMFNPDDATLNLRSEFFAHCRHKDRHLLAKS